MNRNETKEIGSTHQPRRFPERVVFANLETKRATELKFGGYLPYVTGTTCTLFTSSSGGNV